LPRNIANILILFKLSTLSITRSSPTSEGNNQLNRSVLFQFKLSKLRIPIELLDTVRNLTGKVISTKPKQIIQKRTKIILILNINIIKKQAKQKGFSF